MAYYDYYRRRNPTSWGRPEYILDSPPAPGYQPQPQWRGYDYYRAHYGNSYDPSAFDSVLGRIRSHFRSPISRRDAQTWHQRVYSGLVDVATMTPAEIGAAAGYEAWRFWEHHRGIYRQPLMDDHERETEALVGLAVGEAEKLWDYTRRHRGDFSKREALEVAAAVAMKLFRKGGGGGYYDQRSRYEEPFRMDGRYPSSHHRHRRGSSISPDGFSDGLDSSDYEYQLDPTLASAYSPSMAGGIPIAGSSYGGDGYHHHHRRRASSFYGQRPQQLGTSPYIGESALSTSPSIGPLITPHPGHHMSFSFGGYGHGHGHGGGGTYEYRDHNGMKVHRTMHGDPNSEFSHLPPGTYMIQGGSSGHGHHRRRRKSVGRYIL
ncbi:ubiquitin-protein transferase [Rhizoctonia solani]|uniref:Ubiquitin-protein transferase n=1 Tax=Rhizoctonia solani TaxID=456999 RepID=A0A8H7H2Q2_9AGAM|nr:ubiquitin-protein transferase [Rhizoctonia solani]